MIIQSQNIWISGSFNAAQIEIEDKVIKGIYGYNHKKVDKDFGELRIIPGMIDVHTHGGLGIDSSHADKEGLRTWAKALLKEGITAFCPTTDTKTEDVLLKAVKNIADVVKEGNDGADILGIHFEGPYLNSKRKGAHYESWLQIPSVEQFKQFQSAANGLIKIITLACELDQNHELTRYCSQNGVNVSIGHSTASLEDAMLAVANGATSITHTYNAMNGLHHREPSLVGAAMNLKDTFAEIICDGNHVAFPAVRALVETKGKDYCILIDDALCVKGCETGEYKLGEFEVEVRENGSVYLKGTDTLAGGTIKFNKALQNLIEKAMVPIDYAINMATLNPARYLRVDDRKGKICVGYDADLVVLDRNYDVVQVFHHGKTVL